MYKLPEAYKALPESIKKILLEKNSRKSTSWLEEEIIQEKNFINNVNNLLPSQKHSILWKITQYERILQERRECIIIFSKLTNDQHLDKIIEIINSGEDYE